MQRRASDSQLILISASSSAGWLSELKKLICVQKQAHFHRRVHSLTEAVTMWKLVLKSLSVAVFYVQLAAANSLQVDMKITASGAEKYGTMS